MDERAEAPQPEAVRAASPPGPRHGAEPVQGLGTAGAVAPSRFLLSAMAFLRRRPGGWYAVATAVLTVVAAVATFSLPWTSTQVTGTTFVMSENAWRYDATSLGSDGLQATSLTSIWAYVLLGTLAATIVGVVLWLTRRHTVGAVVTLAATAGTTAFALVNIRLPYFVPSLAEAGSYQIYNHGPGGWIASITAAEATVAALAGACRVLAERRRPAPVRPLDQGGAAVPTPAGGVEPIAGSESEPGTAGPTTPAAAVSEATAERRGLEVAEGPQVDHLFPGTPWAEDVLDGAPGPRRGLARWVIACRHRVGGAMASTHALGVAVVALTTTGIASLWLSWITQRSGVGPTDSLSGIQLWYATWSASYSAETLWITLLGLLAGVTLLLAVRWILLPDPVIVTGTLVAAAGAAVAAVMDLLVLTDSVGTEQRRVGPEAHLGLGYGPWLAAVTMLLAVACAVRGVRLARRARVWAIALAPETA